MLKNQKTSIIYNEVVSLTVTYFYGKITKKDIIQIFTTSYAYVKNRLKPLN